ncbi:MAG TPA: hypothetical protein VFE27_09140 [Acidobacteriaceae bacterium]|nr:hypothetical protein [Acidobacteriaceae bacterium]
MNRDVESIVDNARLCGAKVLQHIKTRPSVGAEGYQLSIDNRLIREILQGRRNVREPLVEHILSARIKRSHTALSHYLKPIAVEFYFLCGAGSYVA